MTDACQLPNSLAELAQSYVIKLNQLNLLLVEGEQAAQFLNSQLTIDVTKLADGRLRRAALCDFKGKTWAVMDVIRIGDQFVCVGVTDAMQAALAQLQKYSVFSKVTFNDISQQAQAFFIQGTQPIEVLNIPPTELPSEPLDVVVINGIVAVKLELSEKGYLIFNLPNNAPDRLCTLTQVSTNYCIAVYDALNIARGLPQISGDNVNTLVPQMFNLQALDGIDFKKGCYMGQEVVARTRYLGKNKRAAYIISIPNATVDTDNVTLERKVGSGWRNAGTVIRCATLAMEQWFLVVMPDDVNESDILRVAQNENLNVILHPLPYAIEQEPSSIIRK